MSHGTAGCSVASLFECFVLQSDNAVLLMQGFGRVGCDNWNGLKRSWIRIDLFDLLPCEMEKVVLSDTMR